MQEKIKAKAAETKKSILAPDTEVFSLANEYLIRVVLLFQNFLYCDDKLY